MKLKEVVSGWYVYEPQSPMVGLGWKGLAVILSACVFTFGFETVLAYPFDHYLVTQWAVSI